MYVIEDGDTPDDVPVMQPVRQPTHISWCDGCGCFRNNHGSDFALVQQNGERVQLCPVCRLVCRQAGQAGPVCRQAGTRCEEEQS